MARDFATESALYNVRFITAEICVVENRIERLIDRTPTSEQRNELTEANILLKLAKEKVSSAGLRFVNESTSKPACCGAMNRGEKPCLACPNR